MKTKKKPQPVRDLTHGGRVVNDGPLAALVKAVGTMPALAEMVGVSVQTLRRINQGERAPRKGELLLLASVARTYRVPVPAFEASR